MDKIESLEQAEWLDEHFPRAPYKIVLGEKNFNNIMYHLNLIITDPEKQYSNEIHTAAEKIYNKINKYFTVEKHGIKLNMFPSDFRIFFYLYLDIVDFYIKSKQNFENINYFEKMISTIEFRKDHKAQDIENIFDNEQMILEKSINILKAANSKDRENNPAAYSLNKLLKNKEKNPVGFLINNSNGYNYECFFVKEEDDINNAWYIKKQKASYKNVKKLYTRQYFCNKYFKCETIKMDEYNNKREEIIIDSD